MSEHDKHKGKGQHIPCKDIQDLLFDYMSHELGGARSVLIREHLRKCEECTRQAAEIQSTLDLLNKASREESDIPARLTDERRKKLYWWYSHPFMRWIEKHHIIVSVIATLLALAVIGTVMLKVKLWQANPPEDLYPVWIGDKLPYATNPVVIPPDDILIEGENN